MIAVLKIQAGSLYFLSEIFKGEGRGVWVCLEKFNFMGVCQKIKCKFMG